MLNPSLENPLQKTLITHPQVFSQIDLTDMPDFLHPENSNSELYIYLTQRINWPYYSLQDIFQKKNNNTINTKKFKEWINEITSSDIEKKNKIISSANDGNSKLLIQTVHEYTKFLSTNFCKPYGERIRLFIFLEYFLKKLEVDTYIINSDEYCHLVKLYFNLCRDAENIFEYLDNNKILTKCELFYYEKGCYYERIHKYLEANQTYIEGFINILDENDPKKGMILKNQYINFETRMNDRISRDLESLDDDWNSIDQYMQKIIIDAKDKEIKSKNLNINLNSKKKYFLKEEETNEKFLERKLIKNINIDFSLSEGRLTIKDSNRSSQGIEVIGVYGNVKYIKNPPDITKVTSMTCIYEFMKKVLSSFFMEWKKEYENFDLETKKNTEKLPFSWINKQRPTKRNIKNMQDNAAVLNLVQKEYLNAGINNNSNINNNENNFNKNIIENNNNDINIEEKEEIKENEHEISNMLSNIGLILDKKDTNPVNNNINSINININNNIEDKIPTTSIIEKDNKTLIANIQYQIEHPYENKSKNRIKNINTNNNNDDNNINKKIKKKTGVKTNKFKTVGKLNFDQDGLMIINLENETDKKIDVMQSASKLLLNNNENEKNEKKNNKKYTIVLDNVPRRLKYIKEKTANEKKMFDIRKKEMLQGINFDYLNSFKKLFETYPELNNLLEPSKKNITEEYNLDLNKNKKNNINNNNIIEETNIQRQNGPSDAMKLLLEVYGIPQNFSEDNNYFIEYAKKNGINSNFAFENLFKDIKSYINAKSSKKRNTNLFKNSKKNQAENENKENIDADGDLIIESESEDNSLDVDNNDKDNKNDINNKDNIDSKKKGSKHCIFDSKKNCQIVYLKSEINEKNDEVGKIIDNINKKAEKGIKIGEKTIFSNYKGIKEHNFNNNDKNIQSNNIQNQNLVVNQSIRLSIKKESKNKFQEELNKKKMIINNSKISANIFMSAFNHDLNNNNNNNNNNDGNNKSKSKSKKRTITESTYKNQNLSNSLMFENNFEKNNNFYSESNFSKHKNNNGKLYSSVNDFKINNYKNEKENQLSNIKESNENEKSSKIEKSEKNEEVKNDVNELKIDKNKKDKKGKLEVIGNLHDLDQFDEWFK